MVNIKCVFTIFICSALCSKGLGQGCLNLIDRMQQEYASGNFDSAIKIGNMAKGPCLKEFGEKDSNYLKVMNTIADAYLRKNDFNKAKPIYQYLLKVIKNNYGNAGGSYINCAIGLGNVYMQLGNYDSSKLLFHEVLALDGIIYGKESIERAIDWENLGTLYLTEGFLDTAETVVDISLGLFEKLKAEKAPEYGQCLNLMGIILTGKGLFNRAAIYYQEEMKSIETIKGIQNEDYTKVLNNFSELYLRSGKYLLSEVYIKKALQLESSIENKNEIQYAIMLSNLARIEDQLGNYQEVEMRLKQSLSIINKELGTKSLKYASIEVLLGNFYLQIDNYSSAGLLFKDALNITQKLEGKRHPDYAICLLHLVEFYDLTNNTINTKDSLIKIIQILEKTVGNDNSLYFDALSDLAHFYERNGFKIKAEELYNKILQGTEKSFGTENPLYANALDQFAGLFEVTGNLSAAEPLLRKAFQIYESTLDKYHPDLIMEELQLGIFLYKMKGLNKEAERYISDAIKNINIFFSESAGYLSSKELKDFIESADNVNNFSLSIAISQNNLNLIEATLNNILLVKGMGLRNIQKLQSALFYSKDTILREKYRLYLKASQSVVKEFEKFTKQKDTILLSESHLSDLEKELMRFSGDFQLENTFNHIEWQDIQKKLNPNDATIEFVDFNFFDPDLTDSLYFNAKSLKKYYAAYVIRSTGEPKMIKLCELKQLKAEFKSFDSLQNIDPNKKAENYETTYQHYINELYCGNGSGASGLYKLLWQPLDSLLTGVTNVYYASSGLMNRINLGAVQCPDNKVLSERYQLHLLASTRDIIQYHEADISNGNMLLYGGIQYAMDEDQLIASTKKYLIPNNSYMTHTTRSGGQLQELHSLLGSQAEEKTVDSLAKASNIRCIALTGIDANEKSFKYYASDERASSPTIVHISTHGFFFPDPPAQKVRGNNFNSKFFVSSSNPLLRCGLFMAGANYTIMNPDTASLPEGIDEDGILTGAEISNTYLRQTKLVVLSACETGLGKIDDNEGVYGLQRAFKMAGAQDLIMSLWRVDDEATKLFMTTFYQYALKDKTVYDAFTKTQEIMRNIPEHPEYRNSYYWAAFVLME